MERLYKSAHNVGGKRPATNTRSREAKATTNVPARK